MNYNQLNEINSLIGKGKKALGDIELPEHFTEKDIQDLLYYKGLINVSAQPANEKKIVFNSGEYKACLLMSKMVNETNENFSMVVGQLDGKISDKPLYLNAVQECLNKKCSIDIIFTDSRNEDSKLYKLLLRNRKDQESNVNFYNGNTESLKNSISTFFKKDTHFHFSIYDNDKYRIETDIAKYKGVGVFHDTSYVTKMRKFYANLLVNATRITE